jgi:hypothetical protein
MPLSQQAAGRALTHHQIRPFRPGNVKNAFAGQLVGFGGKL